MNKGLFIYLVVFVGLIVALIGLGNQDEITPTAAQAEAELSIGARPVQVIEQGVSWIFKLIGGAAAAGLFLAIFTEVKRAYRTWTRDVHLKRWAGGPNAQWRQQTGQPLPRLKREDLMLLALMNGSMRQPRTNSQMKPMRMPADEDEISLEF